MNTKISDAQKILREMDAGAIQLLEGWTHAVPVAFCKDGVLFWHGDHAAHRGENYDLFTHPQPAALNEAAGVVVARTWVEGDPRRVSLTDYGRKLDGGTKLYAHPQTAELNEVSGNSGELDGEQEALDIDDVRELFEEWAKGRDLTPNTWGSTSYENVSVDNDWLIWSAAWKALAATGKQQESK